MRVCVRVCTIPAYVAIWYIVNSLPKIYSILTLKILFLLLCQLIRCRIIYKISYDHLFLFDNSNNCFVYIHSSSLSLSSPHSSATTPAWCKNENSRKMLFFNMQDCTFSSNVCYGSCNFAFEMLRNICQNFWKKKFDQRYWIFTKCWQIWPIYLPYFVCHIVPGPPSIKYWIYY